MARRSHRKPGDDEGLGIIERQVVLRLPRPMLAFLDLEAKMMSEKKGKQVLRGDIVKALIAAYYEKRIAGLLVSPDD